MATQNVCGWNKFGYCKFSEKCRKMHIQEICDQSACDIKKCKLRHPRICKIYRDYKRCKFDPCAFKHVENEYDIEEMRRENKKLHDKLQAIEKDIGILNEKEAEALEKLKSLENKPVDDFAKIVDDKISSLESNLMKVREVLAEKDSYIVRLEEKVTKMEKLCDYIENRYEETLKVLETKMNVIEKDKVIKESSRYQLKCSECDFLGSSENGLKVHKSKKHAVRSAIKTTVCELCSKSFKSTSELRRHLKTHSYKKANYKCEECDFVGESQESMALHIGRKHCDLYECGLCEYEAKTSQDLEIHLTTCEIYVCSKCDKTEKTLANLKEHIETEHELTNYTLIYHQKLDRDDPDEVSHSSYFSKDL